MRSRTADDEEAVINAELSAEEAVINAELSAEDLAYLLTLERVPSANDRAMALWHDGVHGYHRSDVARRLALGATHDLWTAA
jgi:hypothetical protein